MALFFPLMAGVTPKVELPPGLKFEISHPYQNNLAEAVPEAIDGGWSPPDYIRTTLIIVIKYQSVTP